MNKYSLFPLLLASLLTAPSLSQEILSSSFVGQAGDSVTAAAVQPDGSIVLAANVSGGPFADGKAGGVAARLSPDGTKLLSTRRIADRIYDMATDEQGNLFAASSSGVVKLDPQLKSVIWTKEVDAVCHRIDTGRDGHTAVLCNADSDGAKAGQITVLDPNGETLSKFNGQHFTLDVCVDSASKTVIYTGFRNARAWEGKRVFPVQIAYVIGRSYSGDEKYRLYDWPTDRDAPGFVNKPTNNMADTRGYRCSIGEDGKLYCAFECAGGNHIFRWEPRLVDGEWIKAAAKKPKADKYHAFYNSRAEHKTFMACFDPATGEYLRGQEFCARLSSGRANALRVKNGAITATRDGEILLSGTAASSLPATFVPPKTGDYLGGSFLLLMKPDLSGRQACVRILPGSDAHAVASRRASGKLIVVVGGSIDEKAGDPLFTKNAIQPDGGADCGFVSVLEIVGKSGNQP